MEATSLLGARAMADVIARRVRVPIGGDTLTLPVLSIDESEIWLTQFDTAFVSLLTSATNAGDDMDAVFQALASNPDPFIDLLVAYDRTGVLPARADLRARMSKIDLLIGCLEVWRAENPLVDIGLSVWLMTPNWRTPEPTSFSPAPMDGALPASGPH